MNVLYVIDSLAPGGAERSLAALAWEYPARGVHLDVAYFHEVPGLQEELRAAGAQLFPLRVSGVPARIADARRTILERKPDLIHTTLFESDVVGRIAGRAAGVPVVGSLVNPEYGQLQLTDRNLKPWKVRLVQAVDIVTSRLVTRFHAPSAYVADVMARALAIRRSRIDVVPRGRGPRRLGERTPERRVAARAALELEPDRPLVLAAARQEYQKGLDLLLRAVPLLLRTTPDAVVVIAGRPGRQSSLLRSMIDEMQLSDAVRLLGARDDVPDLLCAADAFVCPSRWEGFGGAVIEAMALGAPVVSFDIPAVREVLGDERQGLIVTPGSPDALAEAISFTLGERHATAERVARARQRFLDRFTVSAVADGMISFYQRALSA